VLKSEILGRPEIDRTGARRLIRRPAQQTRLRQKEPLPMSTTVLAGQTYHLTGTLAAGGLLTADAGNYFTNPGGLVTVQSTATNNGTMDLLAGPGVYSANYYVQPRPTGATLSVTGTLANNGLISLAGGQQGIDFATGEIGAQLINTGVLTNTGTIQVGAAGYITTDVSNYGTGAVLRDSGSMTNSGLVRVFGDYTGSGYYGQQGPGTLLVSGMLTNTGSIDVTRGTFTLNSATYNFSSDQGGQLQVATTGTLTNAGLVTVDAGENSGAAALSISGTFNNSGQLIDAGATTSYFYNGIGANIRINTGGVLSNSGVIVVGGASGVTSYYDTNAGANLTDNGTLTNSGRISIYAATNSSYSGHGGGVLLDNKTLTNTSTGQIDISGSYNSNGVPPSAATLAVAGTLTNAGAIFAEHGFDVIGSVSNNLGGQVQVLAGGTLTSSGLIFLNVGDASSYINGASNGGTLSVAGVLTNSGTLQAQGGLDDGTDLGRGALISISSTGKLTNSGQLRLGGGYNEYYPGSPGPTGATLINSGSLTNTGTLTINSAYTSGDGAQPSAAVLVDAGVLTNQTSLIVQGGGGNVYNESPGGTLSVSGTLNNFGKITLGGGFVGGTVYYYGPGVGFGGVLNVSGTLANSGTILAEGANASKPFTQNYPTKTGSGATINVTGTLTNQKTIELQGGQTPAPQGKNGSYEAGAQLNDEKLVNNYGTIKLDGGLAAHDRAATLTVTGTLTDSGTITGAGMLINDGTILSGAAFTGAIGSTTFVNNGIVKVSPSSGFTVNSAVTATINDHGTFDLTSGSTLTLNSSVGISQQVTFLSGASTLALGSASTFSATLAGLHPTSTIDFLHTNIASASASGTTLTLDLTGGGTLSLKLSAALPSSDVLKLSSDGHGGTDLLITTAPGQPVWSDPIRIAPAVSDLHAVPLS
jgi:fibronectin-binding autotransporter adhesin